MTSLWKICKEGKPSLVTHVMPQEGGHCMSHGCWCNPSVSSEPMANPPYTVVVHVERKDVG